MYVCMNTQTNKRKIQSVNKKAKSDDFSYITEQKEENFVLFFSEKKMIISQQQTQTG